MADEMKMTDKMKNLLDLFLSFFKVGLFTIGGGLAMLPLIESFVVKQKKWLSQEEMIDCIAVSQSMPGVIAVNVATYIGKKREGIAGAIAATVGICLPAFLIIIIIVSFLGNFADNKHVIGAFRGIKAAVCGLIGLTCFRLGKQTLKNWFAWVLGIAAFVLIVFIKLTAVWVIIGGAVLGVLYTLLKTRGEHND